ncbi:hypothetical protein BDQ17DRAFT_1351231 [Cyathus striatus]|nr:hypothetical protein BDQ17DRAFT_1351231 [Cyathus striatus]
MKAKASGMASTGVSKAQNFKDRNTSVPLKKTNWDPYSGEGPPPPPPPRVNSTSKPKELAPLPPPPRRTPTGTSSPVPSSSNMSPSPTPPLPSRGGSVPPPLPNRSSSLNTPPLPNRGPSVTSVPPRALPTFTPPLPSARASSVPIASGPPPIVRSTRPDLHLRTATVAPIVVGSTDAVEEDNQISQEEENIDWANLSDEDKQVFFSWLDEFFSRMLKIEIST